MSRKILDIAVVTSCHNYGKYLREWAESIIGLTEFLPTVVAIVDNGSTDTTPMKVEEAAQLLRQHGIKCITERMPLENLGAARNRAVEISGDTEWVVHLDADDMFMPHFLQDFAKIAPNADVVGAGYRRCGDLAAGPRNKTRVYSAHQGDATLQSKAPCSGVSPFRRSLWKQSPYRTDMRGGWDTALWIGFAHLNARFVPTLRPVFFYRQHADSIFNLRWPNKRKTHFVGVKLGNLRRKISKGVSVLVPFKADEAERTASWEWVQQRYATMHPGWEVIQGSQPDGEPWRKGRAVMNALRQATGATIVIADSDVVVEPEALEEAVRLVQTTEANWVVPHTLVHRLDKETTAQVLRQDPRVVERVNHHVTPKYARQPYEGYAGGGIVVVDRSDYEAAGGIPDVFVGWGAEDETLAVILDCLLGSHTRLHYDLWHMWHSPQKRMRHTQYTANRNVFRIFRNFMHDPDGMWQLVQFVSQGGDPSDFLTDKRNASVMMVALEKFQRGQEIIEIGQMFRATEEEARRHDMRPRKMAKRMNGSVLDAAALRTSKEKTLDIRAAQAERNERVERSKQARLRELAANSRR